MLKWARGERLGPKRNLTDTCSPYLFITEKIFSELKGRKVREPIKYKGVGGKVRVQEWGKKVSVVVPGGSTSWTAYPIAGDFGCGRLGFLASGPEVGSDLGRVT